MARSKPEGMLLRVTTDFKRTLGKDTPQMIPSTLHTQKPIVKDKKKDGKLKITWSWYKILHYHNYVHQDYLLGHCFNVLYFVS